MHPHFANQFRVQREVLLRQNSMVSRSNAPARARWQAACCWPPERALGYAFQLIAQSHMLPNCLRRPISRALGFRIPLTILGGKRHQHSPRASDVGNCSIAENTNAHLLAQVVYYWVLLACTRCHPTLTEPFDDSSPLCNKAASICQNLTPEMIDRPRPSPSKSMPFQNL